jgi:hypothetical protein
MLLNCQDHVLAATRIESTPPAKERTQHQLVRSYQQDEAKGESIFQKRHGVSIVDTVVGCLLLVVRSDKTGVE